MTAELPSISHLGRQGPHNFGQCLDQDQLSHSMDAAHGHLPTVSSAFDRSDDYSKATLGKYAEHMSVPKFEKAKTMVASTEIVDHKHYEQWARVPGRRFPNSGALLRGIQQLKSRMKRENMEMEYREQRNFHINQLQKNNLLTRDRVSDDPAVFRREKSNVTFEPNDSKMHPHIRFAMKTNLQVLDSGIFKEHEKAYANESNTEQNVVTNESNESITNKPRHGISRIRDRCALPVSVYQPITIGDHVFLINEPIKYAEYLSMKKTEYRIKKDPKSATMIIMPDRGAQLTFPTTPDQNNAMKPDDPKRAKTMLSGFRLATSQKRTPANVSSAEVFDFSQLSEIRNSVEGKLFERSKTEFTFSNKSGRNPRWLNKKLKDSAK